MLLKFSAICLDSNDTGNFEFNISTIFNEVGDYVTEIKEELFATGYVKIAKTAVNSLF